MERAEAAAQEKLSSSASSSASSEAPTGVFDCLIVYTNIDTHAVLVPILCVRPFHQSYVLRYSDVCVTSIATACAVKMCVDVRGQTMPSTIIIKLLLIAIIIWRLIAVQSQECSVFTILTEPAFASSTAGEDKTEGSAESGDQQTVEAGADSGVKAEEAEVEAEVEEVAVADPLASEMMEDEEDQKPEDAEAEVEKASTSVSDSSAGVQLENTKEVCSCVRVSGVTSFTSVYHSSSHYILSSEDNRNLLVCLNAGRRRGRDIISHDYWG